MAKEEPAGLTEGTVTASRHEKVLISVGATFCVRLMVNYAKLCENDLTATMVFLSIALGSTQHLRNRPLAATEFDGAFHRDELRRPVSISAVARSLDLPIETVRRKCLRLAELDLIERTPNGHVVVTARILARSEVEAVVGDGICAMRIFMDQIQRMTSEEADLLANPASGPRLV